MELGYCKKEQYYYHAKSACFLSETFVLVQESRSYALSLHIIHTQSQVWKFSGVCTLLLFQDGKVHVFTGQMVLKKSE
jgi:hypothetical protein